MERRELVAIRFRAMVQYWQSASIVTVALVLGRRALPGGWCVMPQQEEWDVGQWQVVGQLFEQIASRLPTSDCTLLADRGLTCLALIELCQQVGWHYVLRLKGEHLLCRARRGRFGPWERGQQAASRVGQQWYGQVLVWKEHRLATWLSACWEPGYKEAWLLISDRPAGKQRVGDYGRHMRIEATAQDSKSRLCQIEASSFRERAHLDRWLLVVFLALWWLAHPGRSCIHHGHRRTLDRAHRRDKGLFRLGRLWLLRILKEAQADLWRQQRMQAQARLANALPFSHRQGRLWFCISLR